MREPVTTMFWAFACAADSGADETLVSTLGLAQDARNKAARVRPVERLLRHMAILLFAGARHCPPLNLGRGSAGKALKIFQEGCLSTRRPLRIESGRSFSGAVAITCSAVNPRHSASTKAHAV